MVRVREGLIDLRKEDSRLMCPVVAAQQENIKDPVNLAHTPRLLKLKATKP